MRVVYCFCGHCIEGTTDTELFQRNRDHQNQAHPAHQTTDAQTWAVIKANAHEQRNIHYHEQASPEHHTSTDSLIRHRD